MNPCERSNIKTTVVDSREKTKMVKNYTYPKNEYMMAQDLKNNKQLNKEHKHKS